MLERRKSIAGYKDGEVIHLEFFDMETDVRWVESYICPDNLLLLEGKISDRVEVAYFRGRPVQINGEWTQQYRHMPAAKKILVRLGLLLRK